MKPRASKVDALSRNIRPRSLAREEKVENLIEALLNGAILLTIRAYRLSHERALAKNPYPFRPARTTARWSDDTVTAAYASESLALAAMEILTYWGRYASLRGYHAYAYPLDPTDILEQEADDASVDAWDVEAARAYGTAWARARRSLALRVPSVLVPKSYNCIINPGHPSFDVGFVDDLGPFEFDERIQAMVGAAKGA